MTLYLLTFILFSVGLYGLLTRKNLIKIIISLGIMEYAIHLFFVLIGYSKGASFPVIMEGEAAKAMVDPLAQAVVLSIIAVGLAVTILAVALALRIYEKYGTFDITKIQKLKG